MGVLLLIFIFIVVIALIGLGFLYGARSEKVFRITAILVFAFSTLLLIMHVSALPENYAARIAAAYALGAIALAGLFFIDSKPIITKLALTIALVGHITGIFL